MVDVEFQKKQHLEYGQIEEMSLAESTWGQNRHELWGTSPQGGVQGRALVGGQGSWCKQCDYMASGLKFIIYNILCSFFLEHPVENQEARYCVICTDGT